MDHRGDFVGCDPLAALFAHEDDLVAHGALRDLADVEGAHVHRDPARDGDPLSADQRLPLIGERPAEAVAVADRNRGDPGRPPGDERPAVADAVTFGELLDEDHPRLEAHDGAEGGLAACRRRGVDAVGDNPRPHHVQVAIRVVQDGAAVGDVADRDSDAAGLQLIQKLPKGPPLEVVIAGEDLAFGEVGEDPFQDEVREGGELPNGSAGLGLDCPAPAHARIDFDVERRADARLISLLLKFSRKFEIGDRRGQVVFDDLVDLRTGRGGEYQYGRRDSTHAKLHPLVGVCHAESGGAIPEGGVGDLDRPVAVSVRLDHLQNLHVGADQPPHLRPVRGEVAEIDLDPASIF